MKVYDKNPKALANYIANDLQRERAQGEQEGLLPMAQVPMQPAQLAQLVQLVEEGQLPKHLARDVFTEMFQSGKDPAAIVTEKGLAADSSDDSELEEICRQAVAENSKAAEQYRSGQEKAINSFIGPIMKATKGKADPAKVRELLKKVLG